MLLKLLIYFIAVDILGLAWVVGVYPRLTPVQKKKINWVIAIACFANLVEILALVKVYAV